MKKSDFFEEFEDDEFEEDVFSEDNECYDDDYEYDPEDRSTGSCAFCGSKTYGDILCPDCANNVD